MGHHTQTGQYVNTKDVVLAASAARTASANGAALELGDRGTLRLDLAVTAASGTLPTLDVRIETSKDGGVNDPYRIVGTFPQVTTTAGARASFPGCDRFVRAAWDVSGTTPSFTFALSGDAV